MMVGRTATAYVKPGHHAWPEVGIEAGTAVKGRYAVAQTLVAATMNLAGFIGMLGFGLSAWWYLVIHLGTVLLTGWVLWRAPIGHRYLLFVWAVVIPTGGVGILAGCISWPLFLYFQRRAQPFEIWYRSLFPETVNTPREHTGGAAQELQGMQTGLDSFIDIIRFGTQNEKSSVISLISRRFDPAFLPVLAAALNDSNAATRVEAAAAHAQLRDRFAKKLGALAQERDGKPNPYDVEIQIAEICDSWAWSGLADDREAEDLRRRALVSWLRCHNIRPGPISLHAVGRLLVRSGRSQSAVDWLERPAMEPGAPAETLNWYMEALYQLGRYGDVRAIAARTDTGRGPTPGNKVNALRAPADIWRSSGPAAAAAHV
jgi:hypothetical protein